MERFGVRVRRLRRAKGLSQDHLGELSGQSRNYINRLETGNIRTPTRPIAERIAEALDVTADELYGQQISGTGWLRELPADYQVLDYEEDELVELARRLPAADRERLILIARAFYQARKDTPS